MDADAALEGDASAVATDDGGVPLEERVGEFRPEFCDCLAVRQTQDADEWMDSVDFKDHEHVMELIEGQILGRY